MKKFKYVLLLYSKKDEMVAIMHVTLHEELKVGMSFRVHAGKNTVSSTVYGVELAAKDSFTFAVKNANEIYIDASVNGEGISYVAI